MASKGKPKKGPQKHQNATAWKFDKHKTDPKTKILQNLQVINCCQKCTAQIEWKIKYGKYKPLTQPAKCVDCSQKKVKHNYHTRCSDCVEQTKKCAKCGDQVTLVNSPSISQQEQDQREADLQKELKSLPERKRRTFMRYLAKQQKEIEESGESEEKKREAKVKLEDLKERYGRTGDDFDLDDLDDDLDDLDLDEDDGFLDDND